MASSEPSRKEPTPCPVGAIKPPPPPAPPAKRFATSIDPELHDAPPSPSPLPRDPDTLDMFEAPAPAAQDDSTVGGAR